MILLSGALLIGSMSTAVAQMDNFAPPALDLGYEEAAPVRGATSEEMALMQERAELEAEIRQQEIREENFKRALKTLFPLEPEEIDRLLESFKESREAAEQPISVPEPKIQVQTVSLDPGSPPPVIQTSSGHVTTLTVLDQTGQPWPIQDISWAGKFEISPPEDGGHVVRITPVSAHGIGNLSIRLVDLITPITMTIRTGLEVSHYRFDARIPKMGPLASVPIIEDGGLSAVAGGEDLVFVLDGTPPESATKLKVSGVDARTSAWRVMNRVYLRTPLTLLSPGWDSSVTSADGMNVYQVGEAPVMILSDNGRMVHAKIDYLEDK